MVWWEGQIAWDLGPSPLTGGLLTQRVLVPIKGGDILKRSWLWQVMNKCYIPFSFQHGLSLDLSEPKRPEVSCYLRSLARSHSAQGLLSDTCQLLPFSVPHFTWERRNLVRTSLLGARETPVVL